ncbi:HU family DNA-binding protein [Nonomuraea sp. NPDC050202]|jgi:nucleoid DNA-binding protein|uniref:HU family DNA-binding protein n=1 Tax=Nonomuraea sp. NPDC050202 TaxID=3155035 RepID=UPI0033F3343B
MNKRDLVQEFFTRTGVPSEAAAERAVQAFIDIIVSSVATGEEVRIGGLGVFDRVYRKARVAQDPNTGEAVDVPGKWVMRFRPGKRAKDAVNK